MKKTPKSPKPKRLIQEANEEAVRSSLGHKLKWALDAIVDQPTQPLELATFDRPAL